MREGRFYPDHGLERIVDYHERQDARFAEAAAELSRRYRQADPDRHRAGRRRPRQPRPGGGAGQRAALLPVGATAPSPRSATCTATPRSASAVASPRTRAGPRVSTRGNLVRRILVAVLAYHRGRS